MKTITREKQISHKMIKYYDCQYFYYLNIYDEWSHHWVTTKTIKMNLSVSDYRFQSWFVFDLNLM